MKTVFLGLALLALAACAAPQEVTVTGDGVTAGPGEVRGTYDPRSMNRDAVIAQIMGQCGGSYDHVWETPLAGGITGYTARCS